MIYVVVLRKTRKDATALIDLPNFAVAVIEIIRCCGRRRIRAVRVDLLNPTPERIVLERDSPAGIRQRDLRQAVLKIPGVAFPARVREGVAVPVEGVAALITRRKLVRVVIAVRSHA